MRARAHAAQDPFPTWHRRGLPLFDGCEKLVRTGERRAGVGRHVRVSGARVHGWHNSCDMHRICGRTAAAASVLRSDPSSRLLTPVFTRSSCRTDAYEDDTDGFFLAVFERRASSSSGGGASSSSAQGARPTPKQRRAAEAANAAGPRSSRGEAVDDGDGSGMAVPQQGSKSKKLRKEVHDRDDGEGAPAGASVQRPGPSVQAHAATTAAPPPRPGGDASRGMHAQKQKQRQQRQQQPSDGARRGPIGAAALPRPKRPNAPGHDGSPAQAPKPRPQAKGRR